jgi:hypothetical protein
MLRMPATCDRELAMSRVLFALALVAGALVASAAVQPAVARDSSVTPAAPFKLRKVSSYTEPGTNTYHVVGEVVNQTGKNVIRVEVSGLFYNAAGRVVRKEFAYSCIDILPPGGTSPFDIVVASAPAIKRYKLGVEAFITPDRAVSGLKATVNKPKKDENKIVHVTGTVRNNSAKIYDFVQICGALLNPAKTKIIRAGYTFPEPATLRPGQKRSFDWQLFDNPPLNLVPQVWVDGTAR